MEEPPGEYNLEFKAGKVTTLVSNVTLDGDEGDICVFNDLAEDISPPANTRAVDQFNLSCYNLEYGWSNIASKSVNITYNYSDIVSSITYEENLDIYKCQSVSSCSWETLTSTLSSDLNKIEIGLTNFSVFMLAEDTTITTVSVSTGGGGGGSGSTKTKPVSLNIIHPGSLSIEGDGTIYTPIIIENTGSSVLVGITLEATTTSDNVELKLENNFIGSLNVGEQTTTTLAISNLGGEFGDYEIKVIARVSSPKFVDSVKMFLSLLGAGAGDKESAMNQIEFGKQVFNGNPECLELYELLEQADESIEEGKYQQAYDLADAAVQACKDLVSLEGKELVMPKRPRTIPDIVILVGEILLFVFIFMLIYRYYKRRKLRK